MGAQDDGDSGNCFGKEKTAIGRRPRILLLTRNFPPALGGMERYNYEVVDQLAREFDVLVCGPSGCEQHFPPGVRGTSSDLDPLSMFLLRNALAGWKLGRRERPDVVLAGSGVTAPAALAIGRYLGKPVGVFVYGLDLIVQSRMYQALWMPAIRHCDFVMPISRYTRELARARGIPDTKLSSIVHPGVSPARVRPDDGLSLRRKLGIEGRPVIASVGRLVPRKGLVEFIENSMPAIVARFPDVVLLVAGDDSPTSLLRGDGTVASRAQAAASAHGFDDQLIMLGLVDDDQLRSVWNAADVHVFPVLEKRGDVEGFGIVCMEAASFGIPTAAFAVGGVPDAVAQGQSGTLVPAGDYPGMSRAVMRLIDRRGDATLRQQCADFAGKFSWEAIGSGLRDVIRQWAH